MEPPVSTPQVSAPQVSPPTANKSSKAGTILLVIAFLLLFVGLVTVGSMAASANKQSKQAVETSKNIEARIAKIESLDNTAQAEIDESRYQAVFLSNGQVYFGRITKLTSDTLVLEDIYYLKGEGKYTQGSGDVTTGAGTSLVKLGEEIHKPDDKMIIERKNVQFFENLKSDGNVSKAIHTYQRSQ